MPETFCCAHCGQEAVKNHGRRIYCSKRCGDKASIARSTRTCTVDGCDKKFRAQGLCSTHYNQKLPPEQRHPKIHKPCVACGKIVLKSLHAQYANQFCSYECRDLWRIDNPYSSDRPKGKALEGPVSQASCLLPPSHPVMRMMARAPKYKIHVWYVGTCVWCAEGFTSWWPQSRFCSPRCTDRFHGNESRKRKGYPKLTLSTRERVALYERDNWTCWLCCEPVDPQLMHLNPIDDFAPSLDHVIPRAHGGTDDPDNLRLAHRWCNSVRGDERHYTPDALRISSVA